MVQSLQSGERKVLLEGGGDARYVPTGHLIYAFEDGLFALPFDVGSLEASGGPVSVVQGVQRAEGPETNTASANYGVSDTGSLVYLSGRAGGDLNLALADRSGNTEVLPAPPRAYLYPRFSPDDARIAVEIAADDGGNVWLYDISANRLSQLTFEGGTRPLWSPDGRQITFLKDGTLWNVPSDFGGPPEPLLATDVPGIIGPDSSSPDGRVLLFPANGGLHALSLDNRESPAVIVPIPEGNLGRYASFSPDGRWFAYVTAETGALEVFVSPYPLVAGGKRRITTDGGRDSVWGRNGRELFYEDEAQMWVVEMTREPTLTWGNPVAVFSTSAFATMDVPTRVNYDVTADGQRFVVTVPAQELTGPDEATAFRQVHIVLNWFEELKERVPVP